MKIDRLRNALEGLIQEVNRLEAEIEEDKLDILDQVWELQDYEDRIVYDGQTIARANYLICTDAQRKLMAVAPEIGKALKCAYETGNQTYYRPLAKKALRKAGLID